MGYIAENQIIDLEVRFELIITEFRRKNKIILKTMLIYHKEIGISDVEPSE